MHIVTGGAGFIGSNIVSALAARRDRVVVVDWLEVGDKWKNIAKAAVHDVIPPEALPDFLAHNHDGVEAVVHMGAISSTTETDGDKIVRQNLRATLDLWTWCARSGTPFIYASSAATYGDGHAGFDDDPRPDALERLQPMNLYGWSKHVADRRIVRDAADHRPTPPKWAGLKFFNVYGPNEYHKGSMRSVVHQLYPRIMAGEPVRLFKSYRPDYKDGEQLRDFVYVKDVVATVLWLLDHSFPNGIYNVGSGKARSWLDLARAVCAAAGKKSAVEFIDMPTEIRDRYQYFTEARMDRLAAAGCAVNRRSLEDGVADYVQHYLAKADPYA